MDLRLIHSLGVFVEPFRRSISLESLVQKIVQTFFLIPDFSIVFEYAEETVVVVERYGTGWIGSHMRKDGLKRGYWIHVFSSRWWHLQPWLAELGFLRRILDC